MMFTLLKVLYFFSILVPQQQNVPPLGSVVRVHSAKRNDPFGHARPIGRRLSMADSNVDVELDDPIDLE